MTGLAVSASGRYRVRALLARIALFAAVPVAILVLWTAVAVLVDSSVVATPIEAFGQIIDSFGSQRYMTNLVTTLYTMLIAFVFAVILGGATGFALGLAPFWLRSLGPIAQGIYSIPKVTIFPLFLVFLGLGVVTRISFAFVHGFFPMLIIVMAATANLRNTDIYLKLGASLDMSFAQLVRTVLVPAVLPSFLTAIRLAYGLTLLGTILGEMFASNGGLGHELVRTMHLVRIDKILAQIVVIGVIALIPNALLRILEVRVSRRIGQSA